MKHEQPFLYMLLFLMLCCTKEQGVTAKLQQPLISYVNPLIGTGGHGHTYPGATLPFGMMQLSPDTRLEGWDGCSGYHYSDTEIYGFSHTHLSGTGVSDYGDILLMPIKLFLTMELILLQAQQRRKAINLNFLMKMKLLNQVFTKYI
jgi:putative alpha-1,2-mannosidase